MGRQIGVVLGVILNFGGCRGATGQLNAAHVAFGVGETSFTAPFQPLSVTSNTMPSGVVYLTS
jgi:hypothetical protein